MPYSYVICAAYVEYRDPCRATGQSYLNFFNPRIHPVPLERRLRYCTHRKNSAGSTSRGGCSVVERVPVGRITTDEDSDLARCNRNCCVNASTDVVTNGWEQLKIVGSVVDDYKSRTGNDCEGSKRITCGSNCGDFVVRTEKCKTSGLGLRYAGSQPDIILVRLYDTTG